MGLFKKLKKLAGKAIRGAIKIAPTLGLPGAGAIGAAALSKLKTAGAHRAQLRAAAKGMQGAMGKAPRVQANIDVGRSRTLMGSGSPKNARLKPKDRISLDPAALRMLESASPALQAKKTFAAGKARRTDLEKRGKSLTQSDWQALAEDYESQGKPGKWEDFVDARI